MFSFFVFFLLDYLVPVLVSVATVIWVLALAWVALWCVRRRRKQNASATATGYASAPSAVPTAEDNNAANNARENLHQIKNRIEKNAVSAKIGQQKLPPQEMATPEDDLDTEKRLHKARFPRRPVYAPVECDERPSGLHGKRAHWTNKRDNRDLESQNSLHRMDYIA